MAMFKNGNIMSLSLKNFQTFTNQTFTFSPSLNYIAAPNGSGKSSIANGIAFVFNGIPKTIGKSKELCEFIKFGCKEAEIEAEVFYNGKTVLLRRIISLTHNHYHLNGKLVNQKEYFNFLREIKIDVNNLCTFLPQERVGEFCKMNGKEMLIETLKNSEIKIDKIKEFYTEKEKIDFLLEKQEKEKEIISEGLKLLEGNANKFKEKELLHEKILKLKCKKDRISFEIYKKDYLDLKMKMADLKENIRKYDERILILVKKIEDDEGREEYKEHKKSIEILQAQNKELIKQEEKIRNLTTHYGIIKSEAETIQEKRKKTRREIHENQKTKEGLEMEYQKDKKEFKDNLKDFKKSMERLASKKDKKDSVETQTSFNEIKKDSVDPLNSVDPLVPSKKTKKDSVDPLNSVDPLVPSFEEIKIERDPETIEDVECLIPSFNEIDEQIQQQGFKLSQIGSISKNIQNQIEDLQRQIESHSKQDFIRLNALKKYHPDTFKGVEWLRKNKGLFKGEIFEPSFLHINIAKEYSEYVETFLSFQSFTSFIATNEGDFSLFAKILKDEQNLSVNIAMHSSTNQQTLSRNDLIKFGFSGVVTDFIQCKPEYINFFNNYGHCNLIPISKNEINEEEVFDSMPLCRKVGVNGRYSEIRKSKYENDFVILTSKIKQRNILNFPSFDVKEAEEKIKELNLQREINRQKVTQIIEKKESLEAKKKSMKASCDISILTQKFYNLEKKKKNINFYISRIEELNLSKFDRLMNENNFKIQEIEKEIKSAENVVEMILDLENAPKFDLEKIKNLRLDLDNYKRQLICENHAKSCDETTFKSQIIYKNKLKGDLEAYKRRIQAYPPFENLKDLPVELFEIEIEIENIETKLNMMANTCFDQNDYKKREEMHSALNASIVQLQRQKSTSQASLEKEKKILEGTINAFLQPVNILFSEMFERFNCQGELQLDTSAMDWELKIFVKFRKNEEMQQLSSHRQSGGEKSLTTVLFLLALQQCQETAFRLVDEINQGMDPTNEGIVFEIIKEFGINSQFFIITPKMLENMEFSLDSKAIILYGGVGITKDIEKYCKEILS